MADDQVVDQTQSVSTTTDTKNAETTTTDQSKTNATQRPDPAQAKGGDDVEKRFKGIQADLAKERKARQAYEQRLQEQETRYKSELDAERRRVQALAGVKTRTPEEAEADEIRTRLAQVATPDWLLQQLGLTKAELEDFKAARDDRSRLSDVERHHWAKHGEAMVGKVKDLVAKEYGDLTPRQVERITEAYVFRAQRDPEFLDRHEKGDETLAAEFAKELLEDWYEPASVQIGRASCRERV